ncbi:putative polypeptide N-acetylgalactosaminyltransferase 13 isoform X1 [Drosophila serrata]|uniref:putative polypeptide N-acetylgalactosaminyltransferase 13 isoform X1 n=1 Tax=Drosophila serrata TaxID=7274 RepID=UPI000A1CFD87|nr:putative polypeptide N-acetylgalactosaminyltransferase 13 isoform X1 [Drosophila serrata]
MFGGRSYPLPRCWSFYIFICVICQFFFYLVILRNRIHAEKPRSEWLPHENNSDWRRFISRGPKRSEEYYQYNLQLSNTLEAIRDVPRTRHASCDSHTYSLPPSRQAQVSVVISFHNEARSMLLRTIISLLRRTPTDYLHEIILVDDASQDKTLFEDLRPGLGSQGRPWFFFLTNQRRKGLIWSRNMGAIQASGDYVLFLDSHCEVNEGWLEPLLERLALKPNLAVSPVLDLIDPVTLGYKKGNELLKGGFDWSLHFHWLKRDLANQELPEHPFKSPVSSGGVLMMSRKWFLKLGSFNSNLKIWGGESIELAIKLWLCGGQIEIVPCSRIGHIFRRHHAFDFPPHSHEQQQQHHQQEEEQELELSPAQATYLHNSKIIAESWLDDYKNMFYALKPAARRIPLNHTFHQLHQLRTELQCHRFDWYLRHVSPELSLMLYEFAATGTLRNEDRCLHHPGVKDSRQQLILVNCYRDDITQWSLFRSTGQLSTQREFCLGVDLHQEVTLKPCLRMNNTASMSQQWHRMDTHLVHNETHLCLENPVQDRLVLAPCRWHAVSQSFQFSLEMERQT